MCLWMQPSALSVFRALDLLTIHSFIHSFFLSFSFLIGRKLYGPNTQSCENLRAWPARVLSLKKVNVLLYVHKSGDKRGGGGGGGVRGEESE